jgi:hypothetical protein
MIRPRRAIDGRLPALDRQRVFGVGAAKTGTYMVGAMLADTVPLLHEADVENAAEVARWTDIGYLAAPQTTGQTFANPTRFGVLEQVPAPYLIDVVSEACGEWVGRIFPDELVAQLS